MEPDAYTYTILLSVCSNLLPREDRSSRFSHAKSFFDKCCKSGYVNDYVLRKLRQTVSEQEYLTLLDYQGAGTLPPSWTRKIGHRNTRISNSTSGGNSVRSKNSTRSNYSKRRNYGKWWDHFSSCFEFIKTQLCSHSYSEYSRDKTSWCILFYSLPNNKNQGTALELSFVSIFHII